MKKLNWMKDIACYRASHGDRGRSKHLLGGGGDVEPHMLGTCLLPDHVVLGVGVDFDIDVDVGVDVHVHVDSEVGEYIKIFIQSWSSISLPLLMVNGSVAGC